mmetsp:Transcript_75247/g.178789  ORF Transcript_75247/g.178789 Transcript_75247/m.178789 type:complete len:270 (-) Transcript_75247:53-862(-)
MQLDGLRVLLLRSVKWINHLHQVVAQIHHLAQDFLIEGDLLLSATTEAKLAPKKQEAGIAVGDGHPSVLNAGQVQHCILCQHLRLQVLEPAPIIPLSIICLGCLQLSVFVLLACIAAKHAQGRSKTANLPVEELHLLPLDCGRIGLPHDVDHLPFAVILRQMHEVHAPACQQLDTCCLIQDFVDHHLLPGPCFDLLPIVAQTILALVHKLRLRHGKLYIRLSGEAALGHLHVHGSLNPIWFKVIHAFHIVQASRSHSLNILQRHLVTGL